MKRWIKAAAILIGVLMFVALIWFGGPLLGIGTARPLAGFWTRFIICALAVLAVALTYGIRFWRRRRAARALEAALTEDTGAVVDDGAELSAKMTEALAVLKKSSGRSDYLYDLPWYMMIGASGAGKTTALINSGVKFPLAKSGDLVVQGVGGTRYCDWMFAENAVLIDTAGRYTTHSSDAEADQKSWQAFLQQLKTQRPKQPINGVILTISLSDLMHWDQAAIDAHAEILRARLAEIHDTLKVVFPVYVLFTKADLIAGFNEYFGRFSDTRREKVWGATFQTDRPTEETHREVGAEFDALVRRLSEEVTDRLTEEPDAATRIAIFGFAGQMSMLRGKVTRLVDGVFSATRYKVNTILRGFYFTSGTQEGTPFDQVLGAMQRELGGGDARAFMSGKGRAFFLKDLMDRVIFEEAGWVSHDRRAVLRDRVIGGTAYAAIAAASVFLLGAWGWSFFENRALIRDSETAINQYVATADETFRENRIEDQNIEAVAAHLDMIRTVPVGYQSEQSNDGTLWEGFGLSQRATLTDAAVSAYRDGLERMFRPRLIYGLEAELQDSVNRNDQHGIYQALKTYKLLGGVGPKPNDPWIKAWYDARWRADYPFNPAMITDLSGHLSAMLALDAAKAPKFDLNGPLIHEAERAIGRMDLDKRAYLIVAARTKGAALEDFNFDNRAGPDAELVFETKNGDALDQLVVDALYTRTGFHDLFIPAIARVARQLQDDHWVMGPAGDQQAVVDQMNTLGRDLVRRYGTEFTAAWATALGNLKLRPMAVGKPTYRPLAALKAKTSPLKSLFGHIADATRLTDDFAEASGLSPDNANEPGSKAAAKVMAIQRQKLSGLQQIGFDLVLGKVDGRVGGNAPRGGGLPGANIEAQFADIHALFEGGDGLKDIDHLITNLNAFHEAAVLTADYPNESGARVKFQTELARLKTASTAYPDALGAMLLAMVEEFEGDAAQANIAQLNDRMQNEVTRVCKSIIDNKYPFFDVRRDVSMSDFGNLFRKDGIMDRFFLQNLADYAELRNDGWRWKTDTKLGRKLSPNSIQQFERADLIRRAFFKGSEPIPEMAVTIRQSAAHERIKLAKLAVNGLLYEGRREGNTEGQITWPSSSPTGSVRLDLEPRMSNRANSLPPIDGQWAFYRFVRQGRPKRQGNILRTRYAIGGRPISYDIGVDSTVNPFLVQAALFKFRCPNGL